MTSEHDAQTPFDGMVQGGLKTAEYLKVAARLSLEQKAVLASHLTTGLDSRSAPGNAADAFADAEAILRLIAWDSEPPVIEAMARAAAANPNAPRSLIWALANDDETAAALVLEVSGALSDEDLVAITQSTEHKSKLTAIARRPTVSAEVSRSLASHGDETTMHTLLANAKADIPDDAYGSVLDRFGQDEKILEGVINRDTISESITRRLTASLSPRLAEILAARHQPSTSLPGFKVEMSEAEWEKRLSQMVAERLIDEALLVRDLCLGHFESFTRGLAALAKLPNGEVSAQVLDSPSTHLPGIWKKAGLHSSWLPVATAALAALVQIDGSASKSDPQMFSRNVIVRTQAVLKVEKVVLNDAQKRFFTRMQR